MATDMMGRTIGGASGSVDLVAVVGRGDIPVQGRGLVDVPDCTSVGVI